MIKQYVFILIMTASFQASAGAVAAFKSVCQNALAGLAGAGIKGLNRIEDSHNKKIDRDEAAMEIISLIHPPFSPKLEKFFGTDKAEGVSEKKLDKLLDKLKKSIGSYSHERIKIIIHNLSDVRYNQARQTALDEVEKAL